MIFDPYVQKWIVPVKDWRQRIAAIGDKNRPVPSMSDKICARSWGRCVVGKMHEQYPEVVRYKEKDGFVLVPNGELMKAIGRPVDSILRALGTKFSSAIEKDDLKWADQLLDEIDDRVLELKRETAEKMVKKK